MVHDGTSTTLFSYLNVLMEAVAERSFEETRLVEKLASATVATTSNSNDGTLFGSLIVSLIFVPFSIYCGVVAFVVGVECYQFFSVWNLVSRTRTQNGVNLDSMSFVRRLQVSDQAQSREKQRNQLQEKLFITEYQSTCNEQCTTKHSCAICLSDLHGSEKVASIRDCSCFCKTTREDKSSTNHHRTPHLYHVDCLTQWLEQSPSCPYCRDQILPPLAQEKSSGRGTLQLSETLELATLEVEHYIFNALTIFGGMVASFMSFASS